MTTEKSNILIAYGSTEGTAESIARRIFEELVSSGKPDKLSWRPTLCTLDQTMRSKKPEHLLSNHDTIVIVCATTGDGDAPENADRFVRQLKRKSARADLLHGKLFAILGLGDTNYNKFCEPAREIHRRAIDLQGTSMMDLCLADDATGLEEVVEPWIDQLHETLQKMLDARNREQQQQQQQQVGEENIDNIDETAAEIVQSDVAEAKEESLGLECFLSFKSSSSSNSNESGNRMENDVTQDDDHDSCLENGETRTTVAKKYTEHNPFWATVTAVRYLTSDADKVVMHMELDINDSSVVQTTTAVDTDNTEEEEEKSGADNRMAFKYKPGDAIGILPENPSDCVQRFLDRVTDGKDMVIDGLVCTNALKRPAVPSHLEFLMLDNDDNQHKQRPISLRQLLRTKIDIMGQVTVPQLRVLAQYCKVSSERLELQHLASNPSRFMVSVRQQNANILDLLQWFPSCQPNLVHFLQVSQPIKHRYFSIASSPLVHPDSVHIAFSLLNYQTGPPHRMNKKGLCSHHYLKDIVANQFLGSTSPIDTSTTNGDIPKVKVPIFLKDTPEFFLDSDLSKPIIMIGPGTGIAPFRGFIQHRLHLRDYHVRRGGGSAGNTPVSISETDPQQRSGREWLFHGCRKEKRDFLYREELTKWQQQQHDDTFSIKLACSQETPNDLGLWYGGGIYVQDLMREYASDIVDMMLREQGRLYVCGDANSMAKQVHSVMADILYQQRYQIREIKEQFAESKLDTHVLDINTEQDAFDELQRWERSGRYQRDVWTT